MLLTLVLGFGTAAQAQTLGHSINVSLGLKAGASLTNFIGADAKNYYDNRFGFHGGIFANIGFSRRFAFQPELLYSQKGVYYSDFSNQSLRLHYIDVPLALHINMGGLFIEAGPQVSFLVKAEYKSGTMTADAQEYTSPVDIGCLFGLGYQFKNGLGIGLRYNNDFTCVDKATSVRSQSRIYNNAFQLYLTGVMRGR